MTNLPFTRPVTATSGSYTVKLPASFARQIREKKIVLWEGLLRAESDTGHSSEVQHVPLQRA
jgi:hypothetical protein